MRSKRFKSNELKGLHPTLAVVRELKARVYSAPQLMRVTSMTPRQVRHWAEIGLLVPCFRNSRARGSQFVSFYSARDVVRALIIRELTQRGLSLAQVRRVEAYLEQNGTKLNESARYLITDGTTAYYAKSATGVVDILKYQNQMLLIPVWEEMTKLKQKLQLKKAA